MTEERRDQSEAEKQNTEESLEVSSRDTNDQTLKKRTTEEVRQGHTGDHVRYILAISILGAMVALLILFWLQRTGGDADNSAIESQAAEIRIEAIQVQTVV